MLWFLQKRLKICVSRKNKNANWFTSINYAYLFPINILYWKLDWCNAWRRFKYISNPYNENLMKAVLKKEAIFDSYFIKMELQERFRNSFYWLYPIQHVVNQYPSYWMIDKNCRLTSFTFAGIIIKLWRELLFRRTILCFLLFLLKWKRFLSKKRQGPFYIFYIFLL